MNSHSFLRRALVSISSLALAAGCAGASDGADAEPTTEDLAAAGPHVARVTAAGTGCPAAGTATRISADGASVSLDFASFGAAIEDGNAMAVTDCTISVGVDGWQGYQYTLDSFEADGDAQLFGAPATAQETLAYGFMGSAQRYGKQAIDFTTADASSEDGTYSFHGTNDAAHATWSPCTASRNLEVQTRLMLVNDARRSVEGSLNQSHLKLSLRYRKC